MKKLFFTLIATFGLFSSAAVFAQTFTTEGDTVYTEHNNITNPGSATLNIKWKVVGTNFPSDWLTAAAFGICDNTTCINNTSNALWNSSTSSSGGTYGCPYPTGTGLFRLSLALPATATVGTFWVKVNLQDDGSPYNKDVVFIITHTAPSSVASFGRSEEKVSIYPNPAASDLNVVFDASADVKNIAIYNLIGKVVSVYKTVGNSANLNIDNIPSGIYFVKLYNGAGGVVAARKFTKQ